MNRTPLETVLNEGAATCYVMRGVFAHETFEEWHVLIPWQQNAITVYGKEHLEPRLTAWMGPAYAYSSIRWPERPITPPVLGPAMRCKVFVILPIFNACLFNLYRNGVDSMGGTATTNPKLTRRASPAFRLERRGTSPSGTARPKRNGWSVSVTATSWSWKTCSAILTTPYPNDGRCMSRASTSHSGRFAADAFV